MAMPPEDSKTAALRFLAHRHEVAEAAKGTDTLTIDEFRAAIRNCLLEVYQRLDANQHEKKDSATSEDVWGWNAARTEAIKHLKLCIPADKLGLYLLEADSNLLILPRHHSRTPYQYWCVARDLQIIRYFMSLYFDDLPLPIFDVVDLGHFNAYVKRFNGEHLLVFQTGSRGFANLFAKAFIAVLTELGNDTGVNFDSDDPLSLSDLRKASKSIEALQKLFHAYLFLGDPHAGQDVSLDHERRMAAWFIELGMNRFVIAHEYAHIVFEHAGSRLSRYDQEAEADRIGAILMLESMRALTDDPTLAFCGAHIAVALQQKIAVTVSCISNEPLALGGYPSSFSRMANLMAACEQRGILTAPMEATAIRMLKTVNSLYSLLEPELVDTAKRGRQLAKLWQGGI
jgi:hypothetical protein